MARAEQEAAPRVPNLELAHQKFTLEHGDGDTNQAKEVYDSLLAEIKTESTVFRVVVFFSM